MFWTTRAVTDPPLFGGQPLDVVRSPRARRMRLSVDPRTRSVRLTLPQRAALGPAMAWAEERRGWAEAQLARLPQAQPIVSGMVIPLRGQPVRLDWDASYPRSPHLLGDRLQVGGPEAQLAARVLRYLKAEAKRSLDVETRAVADAAGVSIDAVSVGDPVSRWGSCSASGSIRYSWRLILAPDDVRHAIVAHEVAHRVHMNHSPAFHRLAHHLTGENPRAAMGWLKAHGSALHAFGRDLVPSFDINSDL